MKKNYDNSKKNVERRKKKYGCDGKCYTSLSMCGAADTCPETRKKEWRATVISLVIILLSLLVGVVILLWLIRMIAVFLLTGLLKIIGGLVL